MIQLLKDLKIHGDVISDLETLKKEDIDINFRETEIRLLQKMVSDLVNDITTVKEDMATMQNSVSDMSTNMDKTRDRTMETIGKVDAVNADMDGIRKSLEEHRDIYNKMVLFFGKNPDIHDKAITDKLQTIDSDYKDLHNMLTRLETEVQAVKARLSLLEKKVEGMDERLAAVEEQKKHETETRKERLETEGLRELKNQTENILRTQRKLKYILTEQAKTAKKLLAEKRSIVIEGNPGEGKTTLSHHLIDNEMFIDKCVVLNHPRQWEKVDTDSVAIVVLEDAFGRYDYDDGRLKKWMVYLPVIQEHVDGEELQVIVTTRVDVLSKAKSRLPVGSLRLFSKELSLTLSSEQFTDFEKISILKNELDRCKRNMKEEEIKECIANFGGLIGFPQCCSLFAGDSKSFDKGPDFFRYPKKFFVQNIEGLEATGLLPLAFLFCNGKILEEKLSSETMPESSKTILTELASSLQISEKFAFITLLRNAYDSFLGLYVEKSMFYDFTHATVSEAVGHVLCKRCCEMVVKYGDSEYLYQRTYIAEVEDTTSENAFLPVYVHGLLAERMVGDVVNRRLVSGVAKHSALKRRDFIKKLKDELNKGNMLKEFFMACKDDFQSDNLSEGECVTFMQYILQADEDVVRLVYSELLEMLACAHDDNISDCWLCEEKQNLLELALYYHHFEIADNLITWKARYSHVSLCNAAKHGDFERVQTITESLKKNLVFNPESEKAKYALYRAYVSGNQSLIEFLLKEGIVLDCWCVVNAVKYGDMNVLTNVVEHLIDHNKWNPVSKRQWIDGTLLAVHSHSIKIDWSKIIFYNEISYFLALYFAYCSEKFHITDYLQKNGVKIENYMLPYVSKRCSQKAASRVITDLIDKGTWDPKGDDASKALETVIRKQMYDVRDLLEQNGVSLKLKNLPGIIRRSDISLESLEKYIIHLKNLNNWDPECNYASEALEAAIHRRKYDVYELLVKKGVAINMKNLIGIIRQSDISLESVKKAIQYLTDTDKWNPECDDASEALEAAIHRRKYEVYDLLVNNGVLLKMKHLPGFIRAFYTSSKYLMEGIQRLKCTANWDAKCDDASKALELAIYRRKYDVFDQLVQDGVSLKMINLPFLIREYEISLDDLVKVIQHLKDTDNWDSKCDDASKALEDAIRRDDLYDQLVQNGVSLKMKNLLSGIKESKMSLESVEKAVQHLIENDIWDPKCDDATKALETAICEHRDDLCKLLVENGVSLK